MPGSMDGAALAAHSMHAWPFIPVVVMSGLENPVSAALSAEVAFIRKPFGIDEILTMIRRSLGHWMSCDYPSDHAQKR